MSLNQEGDSLVWSNYLDLNNDVKPWLQIPLSDTTNDYTIQVVIDAICQWAQQTLGQPIAPTEFNRRFDGWSGWNGSQIHVPYYPILDVRSCTEWWGQSGPHDLTEQTPENQVDGFQLDRVHGVLIRVFPGLVQKPWFPGSRNIEIRWVAGHNPVPADIRLGTLEMIAYWWRNTQQASRGGPKAGPGAEYDEADIVSGLWAGVPHRIMSFLSNYVHVGMS